MSALVVTFLSHLDVPNAGSIVLQSLEQGTAIVQTLMLEQLRNAETDMHILKASQISVNSAVSFRLLEGKVIGHATVRTDCSGDSKFMPGVRLTVDDGQARGSYSAGEE